MYGLNVDIDDKMCISHYALLMLFAKFDLFQLGLDETGLNKMKNFCEWLHPQIAKYSNQIFNYDNLCTKSHEINHNKPERNISDKTTMDNNKHRIINLSDFVFIIAHVAYECITLNTGAKKDMKLKKNLENKFHMKLDSKKLEDN